MATGVGLRIADDESVVAVVTGDDATLPVHYTVRESVLHMSDDGDAVLGGEAPEGYTHSIRGFVGAVGDPAGLPVDDGEAYRAEDLMATAVFCLISQAAEHLNGPAEFYLAHPTGWTEAHARSLREALDYLGLKSVVLVSERDLPQADAETGKTLAYNAARAALAAVLSTPAGLTPPDATASAVNAADVTDVLPALKASDSMAQAYSAAVAAVPAATAAEPAVTRSIPAPAVRHAPRASRGPYIIAGIAALIGLLLGGIGVAAVLRQDDSTPGPPRGEVRSEPDAATAGVAPPLLPPTGSLHPTAAAPPADAADAPVTSDPPTTPPTTVTVTTTTEVPTTTPEPTRTLPPTTTHTPIYQYPSVPGFDLPAPALQDPWGQSPR
ncbi:hypothetical protein ACFXO9_05395 [Nocardia tengchongensis]|uniref:hypothetical protein n=1 Tax=Nocardia tengchongensis TaxID=2055889 RepID=UPI0036B4FC99